MNRIALALILASSMSLPAANASAATLIYETSLSGLNEVPANLSPGSGFARVTIDDVLSTMRVEANFSGLLGLVSAAHIHCCAPAGTNAGVATTTPTFPGFPSGVQSGSYDSTFSLNDAGTYRAGFVTANGGLAGARAALLAGLDAEATYFNIHTDTFPGGEIRGQLHAVPEPSVWATMMLGFGVVGAALRRRRRTTYATA